MSNGRSTAWLPSPTSSGNSTEAPAKHVVIVGMMGSGKTTLGLALAEHFALPYFDSDQALLEKMGVTGRDLANRQGVVYLHACEAEILLHQLSRTTPSVISAAASTIDDATCRDHLAKGHRVCWLDAPAGLLTQRLQALASSRASTEVERGAKAQDRSSADGTPSEALEDGSHRRKLRSEEFEALFVRRRALFAKCSSVHLDATLPVEELLASVTAAAAIAASTTEANEVASSAVLVEETSHV
jgi:shikimate kinase